MNNELSQSIITASKRDDVYRQDLAKKRLKDLVVFAKEFSPFYQNLYRNIDPDHFVLTDLPITDKNTVKFHFDDLLTDRDLDPDDIRAFVRNPDNIGSTYQNKYTIITTSGTSGNPLIVLRDSMHNQVHALLLKERLLNAIDPEFLTPVKSRLAAVIAGQSMCSSYSSFVKMRKAFSNYEQNMRAFDITLPPNEIITGLNEFQPDILSGYPSIILILAERQISGQLAISPKAIVCSAETLTDFAFLRIKKAFPGVFIMNNYCTTEGGEIAMSCPQGHLHLNDDWILLETVDENNAPVPKGTISEKVLITDLSNRIMPIIRYRVDDQICFSKEPCSCGSSLPSITVLGRGSDTLIFHGIMLPSVLFEVIMYEQCEIPSWQFAQTSETTLEFRAVYTDSSRERMQDWIKKRCSRLLKDQNCSDVRLILSDDLPKNSSRGGKLKRVVKEY